MPAVGKMNDALLTEFREIQKLRVGADTHDVLARYEIAVRCERVRLGEGEGGTYGKRAVKLLAQALGWSPATTYGYCGVARAWPTKRAFDKLVERMSKFDKPLSWSQVVLLATVTDAKRQEQLLADALKQGWSDSRLKREIAHRVLYPFKVLAQIAAKGTDNTAEDASPQPKTPKEMAVAVQNIRTSILTAKANVDTYGSLLGHLIDEAHPTDFTTDFLEHLKEMRRDLKDFYQPNAKQLDKWIVQIEQARKAPARSQDEWDDPADPKSKETPTEE